MTWRSALAALRLRASALHLLFSIPRAIERVLRTLSTVSPVATDNIFHTARYPGCLFFFPPVRLLLVSWSIDCHRAVYDCGLVLVEARPCSCSPSELILSHKWLPRSCVSSEILSLNPGRGMPEVSPRPVLVLSLAFPLYVLASFWCFLFFIFWLSLCLLLVTASESWFPPSFSLVIPLFCGICASLFVFILSLLY